MAKVEREVERWVTSNGRHIPIFKLIPHEKKLKSRSDAMRKRGIDSHDWDVTLMANPIPQVSEDESDIIYKELTSTALRQLQEAEIKTISTDIPIFSTQKNLRLFSYNYNAEFDSDESIQLVKISKGYVVVDGNHRLIKASMDNRKTIKAKIYDMSNRL